MTLPSSENPAENEEEIASAAKVIKSLIKALAKMEEKQDSGSSLLRLPNSNPTRFLPDEDFAFESDLHYGSYNGIRHG